MNNKIEMHIAIHEPTGKLIGIDKADKGKNCQCHCVSCKGELVAKQGGINQWHFAHYHNSKKECDYSFWVACRDLAKQIFFNFDSPIKKIQLPNENQKTQIRYVSLEQTKIDGINFDLSFSCEKFDRIYVYFLTPESNRLKQNDFIRAFSNYILLIDISLLDEKKYSVSQKLHELIYDNKNVKQFIFKRTLEKNISDNLFKVLENEERIRELKLEIKRNTPDISKYNPNDFIESLKNPKFDIDLNKMNAKDFERIHLLDKKFLRFIDHYGTDHNKHLEYKEIIEEDGFRFSSYLDHFLLITIIEYKFIIIGASNGTLIPFTMAYRKTLIPYKVQSIKNFLGLCHALN